MWWDEFCLRAEFCCLRNIELSCIQGNRGDWTLKFVARVFQCAQKGCVSHIDQFKGRSYRYFFEVHGRGCLPILFGWGLFSSGRRLSWSHGSCEWVDGLLSVIKDTRNRAHGWDTFNAWHRSKRNNVIGAQLHRLFHWVDVVESWNR